MSRTMTTNSSIPYATPRHLPGLRSYGDTLTRIVDTLLVWHERTRQRRLLAAAGNAILGDIGVGRAEIEAETRKPFWRG
jgi:uncharacterized protein YjiS (DUF1127 family)